jgi:hypothetical protein
VEVRGLAIRIVITVLMAGLVIVTCPIDEARYCILCLFPGALCNWCVVWANGGRMPVAPRYWNGPSARHVLLTETSRLKALADVLPLGSSVGDWLIVAGFTTLVLWLAVVYP